MFITQRYLFSRKNKSKINTFFSDLPYWMADTDRPGKS